MRRLYLNVLVLGLLLLSACLAASAFAATTAGRDIPSYFGDPFALQAPGTKNGADDIARRRGRSLALVAGYYIACVETGLVEGSQTRIAALGVLAQFYLELVGEDVEAWVIKGSTGYLIPDTGSSDRPEAVAFSPEVCATAAEWAVGYARKLEATFAPIE